MNVGNAKAIVCPLRKVAFKEWSQLKREAHISTFSPQLVALLGGVMETLGGEAHLRKWVTRHRGVICLTYFLFLAGSCNEELPQAPSSTESPLPL